MSAADVHDVVPGLGLPMEAGNCAPCPPAATPLCKEEDRDMPLSTAPPTFKDKLVRLAGLFSAAYDARTTCSSRDRDAQLTTAYREAYALYCDATHLCTGSTARRKALFAVLDRVAWFPHNHAEFDLLTRVHGARLLAAIATNDLTNFDALLRAIDWLGSCVKMPSCLAHVAMRFPAVVDPTRVLAEAIKKEGALSIEQTARVLDVMGIACCWAGHYDENCDPDDPSDSKNNMRPGCFELAFRHHLHASLHNLRVQMLLERIRASEGLCLFLQQQIDALLGSRYTCCGVAGDGLPCDCVEVRRVVAHVPGQHYE